MKTITFNNEIKIAYPEGFHVMNDEELREMNYTGEGNAIFLRDEERHMVVSVGEKEIPGFSALMLNQKEIAKNTEGYIKKANSSYDYRLGEFFERNIGNDTGNGFSYGYVAKDTAMYAECFTVKKKKKVYYYYLYTREEQKEKNLGIWDEILSSISECLD